MISLAALLSSCVDVHEPAPDAASPSDAAPRDARVETDARADAAVGDDARIFGDLQPALDCDDPAFWAAEPSYRWAIQEFDPSTCFYEIPAPTITLSVNAWGFGDFCVRVHASDRPELPVGTMRIPRDGATLGLAAPATIDLEIRGWTYRDGEGWVLESKRGAAWQDPPPPFVLVPPPIGVLGPDVTHVLRALDGIRVTTTEVLDVRTGARRPHGPLLAVGLVRDRVAWVRDEEPPVVEILGDDLATLAEWTWDGSFDRTRLAVLPFGVLSGDRLLRVRALAADMRSLPAVMDEAAPYPPGATARSGDRSWIFDADGEVWEGPSGVAELAGTGELVSPDRRLFGASGPTGSPIDPSIGRIVAIVRGTYQIAIGERGIAQLPGPEPYLGGGTFAFDPESAGVATTWLEPWIFARRPDGAMTAQGYPGLGAFCE